MISKGVKCLIKGDKTHSKIVIMSINFKQLNLHQ